jgi:hypothetical protein
MIYTPIIDNDLVFLAKSKDGDYQKMNSAIFLEWFENQLMPALKTASLVVLDNASYHNVKTEDTVCPNFSQKKAVLQNYLTRQSNPHFAYLHAKQSNVCLYPRVFLGHQTHHSEATYNMCSHFG